jgi:hypothetical protein
MVIARTFVLAMSALAWLALPHAARAGDARAIQLTVPPAPSSQAGMYLSMQVEAIPRGAEIQVTTPSGEWIGTVSPFAIHAGRQAGTYVFPLNAGMAQNGHVTVELSVTYPGTAARPPTLDEVPKVGIVYIPVGTAR